MLHVFIINSFAAEGTRIVGLREQIEELMDKDYLVFNSEYPGHEAILAAHIYELFPDEKLRFYACGGSGTFRNIFNALPDVSDIEFAEYQGGITNDFLQCFGAGRKYFSSIENLINGKVWKLDYIDTSVGRAHNSVSTGIDTSIANGMSKARKIPYLNTVSAYFWISVISSLFSSKIRSFKVNVDENNHEEEFLEIIVCNGNTLGGSFIVGEERLPVNEKLVVNLAYRQSSIIRKLISFRRHMNEDMSKRRAYACLYQTEHFSIESSDGNEFYVDLDGEIIECQKLEGKVVHRGMNYVVPRGLSMAKYRGEEDEKQE